MTSADMGGALQDPEMMAAADDKAQELLDELKREVKAEVEEIGTLRKALTVTVPASVIANQVDHNFDELRHDAIVPGFRKGHAPRRLVEKRFGHEVRQSLKTAIIGQSYYAAIENEELDVLGDPLFRIASKEQEGGVKLMDIGEALQHVTLPEGEDFSYTCELEIRPEFEVPELKGIAVAKPEVAVGDDDVNEALERQQKIRGRFEPIGDGAAEKDDMLVADVKLSVDGTEVKTEENVQVGVRATRLDGVQLPDLEAKLVGIKVDETRTVDCEIPDDYERTDLRGKKGEFTFTVRELKRLKPATVEQLAEQFGCESADQLRELVREDLEADRDQTAQRAQRDQIYDYLLENTDLALPEQLSARQTDRAVVRRVIELRQRGVPESDVEAHIDELRTSAKEQVTRDLKLAFILEKVAEQLGVEVTDEEVNTEIARMARQYNRRFDRVRDELQSQGLLSQLADQIKQDKCITQLLSDAEISEGAPEKKAGEQKSAKKTKKKAKKSTKKTEKSE